MGLTASHRQNERFALHITDRDNVASIREDGLKGSNTTNADTDLITEALRTEGHDSPFPFDRTRVVYCHVDPTAVDWAHRVSTEFANTPAVVVVNLNEVSNPLYLASMSIANEFIDHHVAPAANTATQSLDEAVRKYNESIVQLSDTDSVSQHQDEFTDHPELIVDGDVPTDAIVEISLVEKGTEHD